MNADTMEGKLLTRIRKRPMDVLWGAWIKQARITRDYTDIIGIYDTIWKKKRSDFPLSVDLRVIVAYEASQVESEREFPLTLEIMDVDATPLLRYDTTVTPQVGDTPHRWYEEYEFKGVVIKEPAYYQLSILINQEEKQRIPLWVIAPKKLTWDPENDSTTVEWSEQ